MIALRIPNPLYRRGRALAAPVLLALFAWGAAAGQAHAAPSCLNSDNQCKPAALCTFKVQLAEKVFLYQAYLRNSPLTKAAKGKKREGVRYDGALYDAALQEAKERFSNDSDSEQRIKAASIFQRMLRAHAQANFAIPECSSGQLNRDMLPKAGYAGMFTNQHCQVRVNYEGGDINPEGFGASHTTSCQEFYDRDRAHEVLHQRTCTAAKERGLSLDSIDDMIEDEIAAYRHSVLLSKAYVSLLSIQCSSRPNPVQQVARAKRIQELLTPYFGNEGRP